MNSLIKKSSAAFPFLFLLILFTASNPEYDERKDQILMKLVYNSLNANHYEPRSLNDTYSADVFDLYIQRLDYSKRFFLQEDIDRLNSYRTRIDDEIKNNSYDFLDLSIDLLEKRVAEARDYYDAALKKPFDFSEEDTYEVDAEKRSFASSKKELRERWFYSMKYETLIRLNTMYNRNEDKDEEEKLTFAELEEKAREKVLENTKRWFDRLDKQERNDWVSAYINALANVYDPHTAYFPPKDKEDFDIEMSGRFEGIGARLMQKDDYIEVTEIIPGSASYKQGELEAGDLILEVGSSDDEVVDVVGMRVDHAVKYIRGPKGTEVRLTVKKKDGVIKTIPIIRDVVELEQTYARSSVLSNSHVKGGVGYIYLPKFYANFNSPDGRTSSEDLAREVEKLKKENVQGIIIDLRNNGGGSLQDVVKIAGLFIDSGPVVQVKARNRPPYILKDTEPGTLYDGPLVIMTNFFSASASEILAAAMQDYNRGIVIGSQSTFGKGTVQSFVNLDRYVNVLLKEDSEDFPSLGSVKMTFQKFYRVDGRSTQLKGVRPDIVLPDSYEEIDLGEKEQDFALGWDEIPESEYRTAYPEAFTDKLSLAREMSKKRIDTSTVFNLIHENAKRLKRQREETLLSLNFDDYRELQKRRKEENKSMDKTKSKIKSLNIKPVREDSLLMAQDTIFRVKREKWFKNLNKDYYLNEAVNVVGDINSLN